MDAKDCVLFVLLCYLTQMLSWAVFFISPFCRSTRDGSCCRESGTDFPLWLTGIPVTLSACALFALRSCSLFELGQLTAYIPECVADSIKQLSEVISTYLSQNIVPPLLDDVAVAEYSGIVGRPQLNGESQTTLSLLGSPLTSLADLHGISRSTLCRRWIVTLFPLPCLLSAST